MSQAVKKFDIQYVLNRFQSGDYSFIDSLSEEDLKELNPFVLLMWAAEPTNDVEAQKIVLDDFIGDKFFELYKHPKLQMMLMVAAMSGFSGGYRFMRPAKKSEQDKNIELVMREFSCGRSAANEYLEFLTDDDLNDMREFYKEADK